MKSKKFYYCFNVNNINQAIKVISICNSYKIIPIFYIKFYIVNGFGPDWIIEFRNLLLNNFNKKNFRILVDCKKNYGLFINLVQHQIDYLQTKGDVETLSRLKQIASKNNVIINPKICIIDLSKIKNIKAKINKYLKEMK